MRRSRASRVRVPILPSTTRQNRRARHSVSIAHYRSATAVGSCSFRSAGNTSRYLTLSPRRRRFKVDDRACYCAQPYVGSIGHAPAIRWLRLPAREVAARPGLAFLPYRRAEERCLATARRDSPRRSAGTADFLRVVNDVVRAEFAIGQERAEIDLPADRFDASGGCPRRATR